MAKLREDELKVASKSDEVENNKEEEKDIGDTKFSLKKTGRRSGEPNQNFEKIRSFWDPSSLSLMHEDRIRFGPFSGPLPLLIYEISLFDPPKFLTPHRILIWSTSLKKVHKWKKEKEVF